jgi:hypothetical protein
MLKKTQVLSQVSSWLETGNVQRLVVAVSTQDGGKVVERWAFDVSCGGGYVRVAVAGWQW